MSEIKSIWAGGFTKPPQSYWMASIPTTDYPALQEDMLFIKGCIVTVDALNTQKETVRSIVKEKKADYLVALKENHSIMHDEVKKYFADEEKSRYRNTFLTTAILP